MIRQRVRAGLKRAVESGKQLGRPKIDPAMEKGIKAQLRAKKGMLAIARNLKVGTGTVQGVKREMGAPTLSTTRQPHWKNLEFAYYAALVRDPGQNSSDYERSLARPL